MKIIRLLVHKILITPEGFEAHFKVGESFVKIFLIRHDEQKSQTQKFLKSASGSVNSNLGGDGTLSNNASLFLASASSNTCKSGALW
jgi:hypothetical protein